LRLSPAKRQDLEETPLDLTEIHERLDRLESVEQIRGLVSRYPELADRRDIEELVKLYSENVQVGRKQGREALASSFRRVLGPPGPFGVTIHFVGPPDISIDRADPNRATGTAYCRAEHEVGDKWVVIFLKYFDTFVRENGTWLFANRDMKAFYGADVLERPNGAERMKYELLPGGLMSRAEAPECHESWRDFWASTSSSRDG
jgi:hypothetical protein